MTFLGTSFSTFEPTVGWRDKGYTRKKQGTRGRVVASVGELDMHRIACQSTRATTTTLHASS